MEGPISVAALVLLMFLLSFIPRFIFSCICSYFTKPVLITDQGTLRTRFDISSKGGSSSGGSGELNQVLNEVKNLTTQVSQMQGQSGGAGGQNANSGNAFG